MSLLRELKEIGLSLARSLSSVVGLALAAAVFAAPAQAAPAPPPDATPTIIDGHEAESAPWAARLFTDGDETCTSTIVAAEWILTAQHCVEGADPASVTFNIGNIDQTQGEQATAAEITIHDTADLALVKLDHAVDAEYAPLGTSGDVAAGQQAKTYGWGATCTDKPEGECQAQIIKFANVDVTDTACSDYRGGTAICATRGDGIPAGGDSGGPMFSNNKQVGVASTSDRESNTAYTNVTEYRDWISSVAGV